MLPLELLKVIFGALSRDDLETIMLTSALFRDVVLRDFAKEPFRYFPALNICERQSYVFVLRTGNVYPCEDNDVFSHRMRFGRVGELKFFLMLNVFEEKLYQVLLPLKDAWRDGQIYTPWRCASKSLFDRAFGELFLCKSMHVFTSVHDQLSQSFLSLPAVRECTSVSLCGNPVPLSVAEILEWLNVDARSKEPKRLEVGHHELAVSIHSFLHQLKTDFTESVRGRNYVCKIRGGAYDGHSGRIVNKNTSEELIISYGSDDYIEYYVKAERKAVDEH